MKNNLLSKFAAVAFASVVLAQFFLGRAIAAGWEPTKPVEFVIPAGTGGGADQMARLIQGIVAKHNLMKQSLVPVNKSGGAGALRPLCVFDDTRMPYKSKVTDTQSWSDIHTCSEAGVPTDYVMLRGIFMAGGVTPEQVAFYVDLMKKVRDTPEWKKFMEDGAFNQTFMSGKEFAAWVEKNETLHRDLMKEAGFLAKP